MFCLFRKPRIQQQEPPKMAQSRQNNIGELRIKRISDLLHRNERTDQEEKELKYVKLLVKSSNSLFDIV